MAEQQSRSRVVSDIVGQLLLVRDGEVIRRRGGAQGAELEQAVAGVNGGAGLAAVGGGDADVVAAHEGQRAKRRQSVGAAHDDAVALVSGGNRRGGRRRRCRHGCGARRAAGPFQIAGCAAPGGGLLDGVDYHAVLGFREGIGVCAGAHAVDGFLRVGGGGLRVRGRV